MTGIVSFSGADLIFDSNYTYDENISYTDDGCCGVVCNQDNSMKFEAVFLPIVYSLTFVLGLLGNGLVLAVLCQKRQTWSVTDVFVLHLSIADLLLVFTMPLWAVDASKGWSFGTETCKIAGALFNVNFYSGIFLLACISLDRYFSVVHAVQMYSRKKPWLVQLSCLGVWLFCFFLSIPDLIFLQVSKDPRRGDKTECRPWYPDETWRMASRTLYHILGFLLPACILLFCYSCIIVRLHQGQQGVQKQRAVRVVLVLVLAFFISWTPYNIVLLADTFYVNNSSNVSCETSTGLDIAIMSTSTIGFMHCCINPVLYAFVGVKFRRHLMSIIKPLRYSLTGRPEATSYKSSVISADTSKTSAF